MIQKLYYFQSVIIKILASTKFMIEDSKLLLKNLMIHLTLSLLIGAQLTFITVVRAEDAPECANLIGKYRVKSRESMVYLDVRQESCTKVILDTHFGVSKDSLHQEILTDGKEYLVYDDGSKRIYRTAEFTDLMIGNGEKVKALRVFNATYDDSKNGQVAEVESYYYAREYSNLKSLVERRDHLTETGGYYYRLYLGYVDDHLGDPGLLSIKKF